MPGNPDCQSLSPGAAGTAPHRSETSPVTRHTRVVSWLSHPRRRDRLSVNPSSEQTLLGQAKFLLLVRVCLDFPSLQYWLRRTPSGLPGLLQAGIPSCPGLNSEFLIMYEQGAIGYKRKETKRKTQFLLFNSHHS